MFPNIKVANLTFGWYSTILTITLVSCIGYFIIRINKYYTGRNFNFLKTILFPFIIIMIGIAGCRILSVIEHLFISKNLHSFNEVITLILFKGGLNFLGAPVFILLFLPLLLRLFPVSQFLALLDIAAPVWCLGYALGRFGCLLSGDGCYGTWTNLPWGMYFPYGSSPTLLPVHPTPLYESIIHFILLFIILRHEDQKKFSGQVFFIFLFLTSLSRFIIEFIRLNHHFIFNLTLAQIIAIFFMFLSIFMYFILSNSNSKYYPKLSSINR